MTPQFDIGRFRAGDEGVFRAAFNAYYHRVFGFCLKMVDIHQDAEEIALTAFQALFSNCTRIDSIDRLQAYLFTTTRNLCINHLKHNTRRRQRHKEFAIKTLNEANMGDEHAELQQCIIESVSRDIQGLPAACRRIFELLYFEGLSVKDVAARLGVSIDTVYTQQRRAIEKLKLKVTRLT